MKYTDARIRCVTVDGQSLYIPSPAAWEEMWREPVFGNVAVPMPDFLKTVVARNAKYPELFSALGFVSDRIYFYELLKVRDEFFRVDVEQVFCDACGYRAPCSATPKGAAKYLGAVDKRKAEERSFSLPQQNCANCKKRLHRATVWQALPPGASTTQKVKKV